MMQNNTQQTMRIAMTLFVVFLLSLSSVFALPITLNSTTQSIYTPGYIIVNTTTPGPYAVNAFGSVNAVALCIGGTCRTSWTSVQSAGNITGDLGQYSVPYAFNTSHYKPSLISSAANGTVGINVSNPQSLLHIKSSGATPLTVESLGANSYINLVTATGTAEIAGGGTGVLYLGGSAAQPIYLRNSGYSTRQTILANGKVGINNTNPLTTLDVTGTVTSTGLTVSSGTVSLPNDQIDAAEVNFNYAGSVSEGGAASDVACTTCIALGSEVSGSLPIANGGTGATTAAGARVALALGALANQNIIDLTNTGNVSGALAIGNGGTGATTAAGARTALGAGNVSGTITSGYLARVTGVGTIGNSIIQYDTTNVGIGILPSTYKLRVNGNIGASAYWFTSDENLKKNIKPLDSVDTVSKILALNPVTFEWKNETNGKGIQIGLVAQDVEKIYPELVSTADDGSKSVQYANLVAPLIATAQSQQKQIDAQQQQIDILRAEIEALKAERK